GNYPFRIANMVRRATAAAAADQAQSNASVLTDAMGSGASQLSDGMSRIAAKRAVARINATRMAHLKAAAASNAPASQSARGDNLYFEIDRMINSTVAPPRVVDVKS
ncbi:MAG: hypothetical protein QOG38_866, partial [Hyphomicrobiales bacterium]|nr:hypothetical protein [Hyphomicrobiales bacterium]